MKLWLTATVIIATALAAAAAGACEPALRASARPPHPYAPRDKGSYCEGTYALSVAAGFEVLSVTIGTIPYSPGTENLYISAPLSPADASLSLRARGRSTTLGYQMDATLRPPTQFVWPTAEVVGPLGLGRRDFGLFGFRRSGADIRYVPVAVSRSSSAAASQSVFVTALAPEHLNGPVEYRVLRQGSAGEWETATPNAINRGAPVLIRLPTSEFGTPFQLQIRAPARLQPNRMVRLIMRLGV